MDVERRAAENWFRRRGLPLVVRGRLRGAALLHRAVPALVFLLLLDPLVSLLAVLTSGSEAEVDRRFAATGSAVLLLALTAAALLLPVLVGWLVQRWQRRLAGRSLIVLTVVVYVLYELVLPVTERLNALRATLAVGVGTNLAVTLVLLALIYLGAGSILGWALRGALRQVGAVGTLTSRALPLLLLFVLFAFFGGELWQAADALSRPQLWTVVAFFAVLGGLFVSTNLSDELRAIARKRAAADESETVALLAATPLAGAAHRTRGAVTAQPLSLPERANVVLVLFFAQALQIVAFAVLVFAFFMVFGTLAVPDAVQQKWVGEPLAEGTLFGLKLGVSNVLVQVSLFLCVFSGLYFAASMATDAHYRTAFFEPLLADVAVSLAAREVYLARWSDEEPETAEPDAAPVPPSTI